MAAITYPLSATEALQEVRAILNETTAAFYTDEQINNWIIVGAMDTSIKSLCVGKLDTVTLAAGTFAYTALTSAGAGAVAKIVKVLAAQYHTSRKGLLRVSPTSLNHITNRTAGPPDYYYHHNTNFVVYPAPAAAENNHLVYVWYAERADGIDDLPEHYQHFAIWYAVAMAKQKALRINEAQYWMQMYLNGVTTARADLYNVPPDGLDMLSVPERVVLQR